VSRLQRALHRVVQERLSHALSLPAAQAREQHDRYRMPRESLGKAFRGLLAGYLPCGQRVVTDDSIAGEPYVGLVRTLALQDAVFSPRRYDRIEPTD
jgi:hypothetical protein